MATPRFRLTRELLVSISARIGQGAFDHVASESVGIPYEIFQNWYQEGRTEEGRPLQKEFFLQVRQARAKARLAPEMELRRKSPKIWLLHGPGKITAHRPGWSTTAPVSRQENESFTVSPEILSMCYQLQEFLNTQLESRGILAPNLNSWKQSPGARIVIFEE